MSRQRIALAGPGQQGNLALDYLAAAAVDNGDVAGVFRFDGALDLDSCVDAVMAFIPDVVGFNIAFQHTVGEFAKLARALRDRGFKGHITCGGHVPTLCADEILSEIDDIDSVVRHEGEETLVELADALSKNKPFRSILGLTWRENGATGVAGTRPLKRNIDDLPLPRRPRRPYVIGGFPAALVIGSRGCEGDCPYCSIGAFCHGASGKSHRLRSIEGLADELASLHHEHGIRVVVMQDGLFIPSDQRAAVSRMRGLKEALNDRGVSRMLFSVKGRPEVLTEEVIEAASAMGVMNLFLGVENASAARLRYLGRRHSPRESTRALAVCRGFGIRPAFNIMLFDPECTVEDVEANLRFLEAHLDLPWTVSRTEVYTGTPLFKKLHEEGRLEGDYKYYNYVMTDKTCEVMFRISRISLKDRGFARDNLLFNLSHLLFAVDVHARFLPSSKTTETVRQIEQLTCEINRSTLDELKRTLEFAQTSKMDDLPANRDFAVQRALSVNEQDHLWRARIDDFQSLLTQRGLTARRPRRR